LGTGEQAFEPVANGQHLRLYAGTQGGHHVWLSFRVRGLAQRVRMLLEIEPPDPAPPSRSNLNVLLYPVMDADAGALDDTLEYVGFPARILSPECAVGKATHLSLSLRDAEGHEVESEIDIIPDPPEGGFATQCDL
jgi:hypothetical protein